jgi:hypothetical protein
MISTSRPMTLASKTCLAVAMSLSLLALTACSAEAEGPKPEAAIALGNPGGVLKTSAGVYEFTPTTCAIYKEDGVDDIEIQGPGTAPDGEKFYFELSSTGNAITIELGVEAPFKTSDRQIRAGQYVSKAFTVDVSGLTISVPSLVLVDEKGQPVDINASLRIDCDA